MKNELDFSIVIPIKDEAESIGYLLDEITCCLKKDFSYEIILVDDGSVDDTQHSIRQYLPYTSAVIRYLQHDKNYGQSAALYTGIQAALSNWIITMDGDGQNDPADIKHMINHLRNNKAADPKLLCGHRINRKDTWIKKVSSRIANRFRSRLLGDETPDTGCGIKMIHRETFLNLPRFDHMHRFLPALFRKFGHTVCIVEVNHRYRMSGKSKYGIHNRLWTGLIDVAGMIWLNNRCLNPYSEEIFFHDD